MRKRKREEKGKKGKIRWKEWEDGGFGNFEGDKWPSGDQGISLWRMIRGLTSDHLLFSLSLSLLFSRSRRNHSVSTRQNHPEGWRISRNGVDS